MRRKKANAYLTEKSREMSDKSPRRWKAETAKPALRLALGLNYAAKNPHSVEVAAVGRGELASQIQRLARRYGIPVRAAGELAEEIASLGRAHLLPEGLRSELRGLLEQTKKTHNK